MPTVIDQLDIFIGQKLKFLRTQLDWPLKILAEKLDVSLQQLQKYEQGTCKVSASLLYRLAQLFQIPTDSFFEGYSPTQNTSNTTDFLEEDSKKTYNILLVEDNTDDEFLLRKALETFSVPLNVYTVHDGQKALELFRTFSQNGITYLPKPDIIFLDLNLPSVKGIELLKDLKRRPGMQNIPVIVLSNSLSKKDMNEAYGQQASGFVRKSFCFEDFKEHIQKALTYWTQAVVLPQDYS